MGTKSLALALGVTCHVSFCAAVVVMFMALFGGLNSDAPATSLGSALIIDIFLLAQFPVIHTLLLRPVGRRFLASLFPGELGKHLITTTFVIAASLQLLMLFLFWSHIGASQWEPSGTLRAIWTGVYAASWALLAIAMTNAGLSTQMGYLGWTAVFRGQSPQYPTFPKQGLYKICRHPVYFSMALVSCTGPIWNLDHALIAVVFLTYCILGPKFKERRLLATHGPEFAKHLRETPFFPTLTSCWRALAKPGAA
jgi:methanethiol S-methyltransferase